jgi:predicted dienelactone hydrolase
MDVSGAQAACAAGSPSDIFCDYVGYWPAGETVKMDPPLPGLKASIALAPGGYSAFGDAGLAAVDVPVMLFGGTLDPTCPVAVETDPIYNALPPPKYEVVITDASHMSFTNVCDLPLAQQFLADYCGVEGMLSPEEAFKVTNALAVSFLNYYVRDKAGAKQYLTQAYIDQAFGDAQMKSDPVN